MNTTQVLQVCPSGLSVRASGYTIARWRARKDADSKPVLPVHGTYHMSPSGVSETRSAVEPVRDLCFTCDKPVSEVLEEARNAGIRLRYEDGQLEVIGPKGTEQLADVLIAMKEAVAAHLCALGLIPGELVVLTSTDPAAVGGRWVGGKWYPPPSPKEGT